MRIIFDSGVLYKIGSDRALRSLAQQGVFNGTYDAFGIAVGTILPAETDVGVGD